MTPNDKNYVDRLHNQQVNELNEIKNRLLILEGKPSAMPNGNIRVEIDTDKGKANNIGSITGKG